ncbi:MAG: DUF1566 domain-containing protein, partial [Methylococcaceae bacterium]
GHGVQADGVNYLIPIDANIKSKVDLKYNAYDVNYFLDEMENAENPVNIVILDACRNNPYKGVRSISGGLANADAPTSAQGSLIAYATAPNSVADDNQKGNNGLYTKYLKQYLFAPGLTIEAALKKVGAAVKKENPDQIPWQSNSLTEDVCLGGCTSPAVKPVTPIVLTNNSPLLSFVSGAATVEKDKTYTVNFKATDKDKDLSQIQIDWLDGSDVTSKNAVDGAALSFTHNYTFAGIYALVATALDNAGNVSKDVSKSVTVKEPVVAPPVVKAPNISTVDLSSQSITQGDEIIFSVNLSSALPSGYSVKVNYGNGFVSMDGTGTRFNLTAIPNSSAMYKIGIYDSAGKLQGTQASGSFEVTQPQTESAPTLRLMSAADRIDKDAVYSVTMQASDDDNNLNSVAIDWGDGKQNSQTVTNNSSAVFNHTYSKSGNYSWTAVAYDATGLSSATLTQKLTVNQPVVASVILPTIKEVRASPSSTTLGNSVSFSGILSDVLPAGYGVKVDFGNGWYDMERVFSAMNYVLQLTPSTLGLQTFKIGIFDNAGTLKGLAMTGTFEITQANNAPTLSLISGADNATIGTAYTLQLQASDSDGDLSFIQISNWGDGGSDSKNATNGTTVSFSHTFNSAGTYAISSTAYDAVGATSKAISKTVTVSKPVVVTPVNNSGTSSSSSTYTKIANNGSLLSDSAKLGTAPTDWACTKDNKTGLVWEVKTDDGGLRDKDWYYSWYKPEGDNGGNAGYTDISRYYSVGIHCSTNDNCNTYTFTNAVNKQGLCGAKDWRMPTIDELEGLLTTTNAINQPLNKKLYIDANYFPNSNPSFWSSSPNVSNSANALVVGFYAGSSYSYGKNFDDYVRLVR